ncbi:Acyl-CoA dehydrogenase- N-terminal [Apiospora phragmitis]|uniref:Acyl-CoA dehydrogenase- N-terminal n=1 Tax=Apiospora phragmitis TaxID=2905665 RepID=A0ABR1UHW8_9PEZI
MGDHLPWAEPAWLRGLESPYYNDSHRQFQRYVRDYVDTHLLPHALAWEAAGEAPRPVREQFARSGLAFLDVPLAYRPAELRTVAGGIPYAALDAFHELILMDEMARLPSGVAIALAGASNVGAPPVLHAGTEAQKRRWLPGLFAWDTSFCLAITEATAGSDVSAIRASAVRTPDGAAYVVNGLKKWVTGAPWATHMTTAVRTTTTAAGEQQQSGSSSSSTTASSTGISLLVIPLDAPGVSIRKIHNTGHNAGGSSWVELTDVHVPVANRLGPEGGGFGLVLRNFNKERFILAVDCNRQARVCLAEALRYAHDRETFGRPLAAHQLIRFKLVSLARDVDAHWAWLEQIAYHVQRSPGGWQTKEIAGTVALAKIQGAQVVERAVRESQQIHGGRGYERGRTVTEQVSRDLRLKVIGGGSEEILSDLAWREEHKMAKVKQQQQQVAKL